uniref:ARAD1C34760p n=1 Tax=Blastobotrys adeninivorans TaxID=409370 RepID=A0A060T358_BLAAD
MPDRDRILGSAPRRVTESVFLVLSLLAMIITLCLRRTGRGSPPSSNGRSYKQARDPLLLLCYKPNFKYFSVPFFLTSCCKPSAFPLLVLFHLHLNMSSETPDVLSLQTPEPSNAILQTLENWRHVVTMLQDYLSTMQSTQKHVSSGLEKARKAIADAPKFTEAAEGSQTTGIVEAMATFRAKTDEVINKSAQTEEAYKGSVAAELETLRADIDKHIKGLKGNNFKNLKDIEKARSVTKKHIESLGHYTSSSGGSSKNDAKHDPFVLKRVTLNAIEDQLQQENMQSDAALQSQNSLRTLQNHIVQVLKNCMSQLNSIHDEYASGFSNASKEVTQSFDALSEEHEWQQFTALHNAVLVPDGGVKRTIDDVTFANAAHPSTKPLVEGILERKGGKILKSYSSEYHVLTPAGFIHSFKSQNHVQDPTPEFSLYLPEATLGPISDVPGKHKFTVFTKGSISKHSYAFKAPTVTELEQWYNAIKNFSSGTFSQEIESPTSPQSPVPAAAPAAAATTAPDAAATGATTAAAPAAATTTAPAATAPETVAAKEPVPATATAPAAEPASVPATSTSGAVPADTAGVTGVATDAQAAASAAASHAKEELPEIGKA